MSSTPTPIENLWKVDDVMRFIGVGRTWVYEAARRNALPHVRLGNTLRFEPDEVRAWVAKNRIGRPANVLPIAGGRR